MIAILLAALLFWVALCVGTRLIRQFGPAEMTNLEQAAGGGAIGLAVAGYGVYALGMVGLLSPLPVAGWWCFLAIAGFPEIPRQWRALTTWMRIVRQRATTLTRADAWPAFCASTSGVFGVLVIISALRPPSGIEWDALSYHLADPAVFIRLGRIVPLPTEHHSNFPFTMEMLYAVGLLFNGYALANLFSFCTAALTVLGVLAFGRRLIGRTAGYTAALVFASIPLVLWESSTAYVDVAGALYSSLAMLAALSAVARGPQHGVDDRETRRWVRVAGVLMGFALGIKYLALIPLGLLALLLAARRLRPRTVVAFIGIALLVGCPWYAKNAVVMRNPVYPFYYKLFPQSRYWSQDRENSYHSEQSRFGYAHSLGQPRAALINLLESPWRIASTPSAYYNPGEYNFAALMGGLLVALCGALAVLPGRKRVINDLYFLVIAQLIIWFFLAQIGRYLLQLSPLAALIAGACIEAWGTRAAGSRTAVWVSTACRAAVAGQAIYVAASLLFLPAGGQQAIRLEEATGLLPTALSPLQAWSLAVSPSARAQELSRTLDVYDAEIWVNNNTPPDAGVALYDETRGFYLDRPYLWANGEHSSYIPYSDMSSGAELTNWLLKHGIKYALINLNWSPSNQQHIPMNDVDAVNNLEQWYVAAERNARGWRRLVGDAIGSRLWSPVFVAHGVVVLAIGASR